jgi:hypothetical protein
VDVLRRFRSLRVNLSIPTDSEEVRQAFEPKAPPLERRWQALAELKAAGLMVGICLTPLLPLAEPAAFVQRIVDFDPDVLVLQEFHDSHGGFGADTSPVAREGMMARGWTTEDYQNVVEQLRQKRQVYEGEAGFFPPPAVAASAGPLFGVP